VAYRPSRKRKAVQPSPEINVTPIMNLMVVLIPMLLAVAQFVRISLIEYQPPPAESHLGGEGSAEKRLDLVLNVLPDGFEISCFGATRGEHYRYLPKRDTAYDFAGLGRELQRIRREIVGEPVDSVSEFDPVTGEVWRRPVFTLPDAEVISIAARGGTDWEMVVRVMDTARSYTDAEGRPHPLFPIPRLGQIQ